MVSFVFGRLLLVEVCCNGLLLSLLAAAFLLLKTCFSSRSCERNSRGFTELFFPSPNVVVTTDDDDDGVRLRKPPLNIDRWGLTISGALDAMDGSIVDA